MRVPSPVLAGAFVAAGLPGVLCGAALLEKFRFRNDDASAGDPVERSGGQLLLLLLTGGSVGWLLTIAVIAALACAPSRRVAGKAAAYAVPVGAAIAAGVGVGVAATLRFDPTEANRTLVGAVATSAYAIAATACLALRLRVLGARLER